MDLIQNQNTIPLLHQYLTLRYPQDYIKLSPQGSIQLLTNTYPFEKCYTILLNFHALTPGILFHFSSQHKESNRNIEYGLKCSISNAYLKYEVIYKRYDLFGQLLEDYSSEHNIAGMELNRQYSLLLAHETGRLYSKPKFHINGKTISTAIEYPKIKSSNLSMYFFQNIESGVKEIKMFNEVIDLNKVKNKQPFFHFLPQYTIEDKIRDLNHQSIYLLSNYNIESSEPRQIDEIGGAQILVPLFSCAQDEYHLLILFKLLVQSTSGWLSRYQITNKYLFQQIAQQIKIPITNSCLNHLKLITEPRQMKPLLRMLFDINFYNHVEDLQQYCILLQQLYFSEPKSCFQAYKILNLARFLIYQQNPMIQNQILQIMIFGCQYDINIMRESFSVFLKVAQASEIELKLKTLQSCIKLISDLQKSDIDGFLLFRQANMKDKVLFDLLYLLQTDSAEVTHHILQLIILLTRDSGEYLELGMICYITKVLLVQDNIEILVNLTIQLMMINKQCVMIMLFLFEKTKSNFVIEAFKDFVNKTVDYQQLFESSAFQLLDFIAQYQSDDLISIFTQLANRSYQALKIILIWCECRQNTSIVEPILKLIILSYSEEDLFCIQNFIFYIHIYITSLAEIEVFLQKIVAYVIQCNDDLAIQQFVIQQQFLFVLQEHYNKNWEQSIKLLIQRIAELQTQESEEFIINIIQLTQIKDIQKEILSQISIIDRKQFEFDYDQFQQSNQLDQHTLIQFTEQESQTKIIQSLQLGQINQLISERGSSMLISIYKLFNQERKARHKYKILWTELQMTYYRPKDCKFQYDETIDQDHVFQPNPYYKQKIMKYLTQMLTKPFLKIVFLNQPKYEQQNEKLNLKQNSMMEVHQLKSLYLRQCGLTVDENNIVLCYNSYKEDPNHLTLLHHKLQEYQEFKRKWATKSVKAVYDRIYIRNRNAVELVFEDGEQLYLIFNDDCAKNSLLIFLQYQAETLDFNKCNNLSYLMYLNFKSQRSYIDYTRYPVFPWVLKGEASDFDNNDILSILNENNFRDLSLPMGAIGSSRRLSQFERRYETDQFYYGTHYSSLALISQYLIRLPPFTQAAIQIQDGKFDIPDRLFKSILKSWIDCNEEMADVRELTPEFFCLPEMFLNINALEFGKAQNGQWVNNILLPFHANKNPFQYVTQNIIALESKYSEKLNQWIDLIWGYKQQGQEAVQAYNVFYPLTYSNYNADLMEINELAVEAQIAHFGQTPEQLFTKPHAQKNGQEYPSVNKQLKLKSQQDLIFFDTFQNKLICIFKDFTISIFKLTLQKSIISSICTLDKSFHINNVILDPLFEYPTFPITVTEDYIYVGAQIGGRLQQVSMEKRTSCCIPTNSKNTITGICYEHYLIIGDSGGMIQILSNQLEVVNAIQHTNNKINIIIGSGELNIFLVGTACGEIFIYNLYNHRLYRTLLFKYPINHLKVSSRPIACLVFSQQNDIIVYSINGFYLARKQMQEQFKSLQVFQTSINYLSLIYQGKVIHCLLPFMNKGNVQDSQIQFICQFQKLSIISTQTGEIIISNINE